MQVACGLKSGKGTQDTTVLQEMGCSDSRLCSVVPSKTPTTHPQRQLAGREAAPESVGTAIRALSLRPHQGRHLQVA